MRLAFIDTFIVNNIVPCLVPFPNLVPQFVNNIVSFHIDIILKMLQIYFCTKVCSKNIYMCIIYSLKNYTAPSR